jgi:hypothetical protein
MKALVERPVRRVLEHHHPGERLFLLAEAEQVDEVLVVYSRQGVYLLVFIKATTAQANLRHTNSQMGGLFCPQF